MAVSTSALTLMQYAILSNDPIIQQITWSLLSNANILDDLPLLTRKTILLNGTRWEGNLPTVNWAKLNTEPTVTSGTPTPYQEQAYLIRNAIDVDRILVEDENQIVDPRGAQAEAYLKAVAYDMNDKFINNDHTTGEDDAYVGLRARINSGSVYGVNSDMKIDAGGLDLSPGGISAATANTFLEEVDKAFSYMGTETGDGVTIYVNDTMKRRFARCIRVLGAGAGFTTARDAFDRPIDMYKGAKVKDIGRKADQSTRIITTTETSAGAAGSSDYTSLYFVRYGEGHTVGWQFDALGAKDIGMIGNAGTIYRLLFDWAFGLWITGTRDIARIYGVKIK